MKKIFRPVVAISTALALSFGVAVSPAAAGNGRVDFYLDGGCSVDLPSSGWVELNATNYDSGSNQTYHMATLAGKNRSGPGGSLVSYSVISGVYVDGKYVGKGADFYVPISGHGRHKLMIGGYSVSASDGKATPTRFCSFYL